MLTLLHAPSDITQQLNVPRTTPTPAMRRTVSSSGFRFIARLPVSSTFIPPLSPWTLLSPPNLPTFCTGRRAPPPIPSSVAPLTAETHDPSGDRHQRGRYPVGPASAPNWGWTSPRGGIHCALPCAPYASPHHQALHPSSHYAPNHPPPLGSWSRRQLLLPQRAITPGPSSTCSTPSHPRSESGFRCQPLSPCCIRS